MILFLDGVLHHENVILKPSHPLERLCLKPAESRCLTHDDKIARATACLNTPIGWLLSWHLYRTSRL